MTSFTDNTDTGYGGNNAGWAGRLGGGQASTGGVAPAASTAAAAAAASWQQMRAQAPTVQSALGPSLSRTTSGSGQVMANAAVAGAGGIGIGIGSRERRGGQDDGFWETPTRTAARASSPLGGARRPGVSMASQQGQQQRLAVGGGGKSAAAFGG